MKETIEARIEPAAPGASPLRRITYAIARRKAGGTLPAPVALTAHHRRLMVGYGTFELALEGSKHVPARLKELGVIRAAQVVACEWCMDFGPYVARRHVADEELRELHRYRESDLFDELERLVLDYATAMSRTPAEVGDELFAALRARFDETQIVELTAAIAIENYRARFNQALGMEPQGYLDGAACLVHEPVGQERAA